MDVDKLIETVNDGRWKFWVHYSHTAGDLDLASAEFSSEEDVLTLIARDGTKLLLGFADSRIEDPRPDEYVRSICISTRVTADTSWKKKDGVYRLESRTEWRGFLSFERLS
jgi:hypothetical protein